MQDLSLSRRARRVASCLCSAWLVLAAGSARADDVKSFEVAGEADAGASDPRAVAVDDAFAEAVKEALEDLLPKATRAEHRAALAKEVIGRARRWVASYKVVGDETADGRRKLAVSVRIDLGKLRARLEELGVAGSGAAVGPGAEGSGEPPSSTPDEPSTSPDAKRAGGSAVILLRARRGDRVVATYGAGGDRTAPGASAAAAALTAHGLVVRDAPLRGPSPSAEKDAAISDAAARALAKEEKVELAVLVEVDLDDRQVVRGVAQPMVLAHATTRVVATSRDGSVGQSEMSILVPGGENERAAAQAAVDRVVTLAVAQALPGDGATAAPALIDDDFEVPAVAGAVWLRVAPQTPWRVVGAVLRHLGKQPGVTAELRRLSPAGTLVLVTSPSGVERVAALTKSTSLPGGAGALKVRSAGGLVTVRFEEP